MHRVVVEHISPLKAIELKDQVLLAGLILNKDFFWQYSPATYNNDGYSAVTPKLATFTFTDAPTATFYKLKWT